MANNGGVEVNTATGTAITSGPGTNIVEFAAAHLPAPPATGTLMPALMPDIVLGDDGQNSIQAPWALAFDAKGNLWWNNANAPSTVLEFNKEGMAMTGAPLPILVISPIPVMDVPTLNAPNGLCFNKVGDMAVTNSAGAFGLAFFTTPFTGGATVPNTFIVGAATTLNAPAGCAFGTLVN